MAQSSASLADHVAFRDALRADPELRRRYRDLKRALAEQHPRERATYSQRKGAFIAQALAAWRAQGQS